MPRRQLAETVRTLSVLGPVSRALTSSPTSANPLSAQVSPDDAIYFDLFRHGTVPSTCSFFPSDFWTENIMQLSHSEPAFWHVTVALGVLHQRAELLVIAKKKDDETLTRRAEAHYGKAMALAKDLESNVKVATLSIALVAAASLLNRLSEMQKHILAGLKIASQQGAARHSTYHMLQGSLMRTDLQAMSFSPSDSPYPYEDSEASYAVDQFLTSPPPPGTSLEQLSSEFFGMARSYFLLDDGLLSGSVPYGPWITKFDGFLRRLVQWESKMEHYEASHQLTPAEQTVAMSLRLYHIMYRLLMRAGPLGPESRYDDALGFFEYAVRLAATVVARTRNVNTVGLSLEPGVIIPMWMAIHRCRHYSLRHAALRVMKEAQRVEGMWRSDAVAVIMGSLVATEEESLGPITAAAYDPAQLEFASLDIPWRAWSRPSFDIPASISWSDVPMIPENKRVRELLGTPKMSERRVHIRLLMCPESTEDVFGGIRDYIINF